MNDSGKKALELIARFGGVEGAHHKAWVIDQVARILADDYEGFITSVKHGEDGPDTYEWDEGISP